MSIMSVGGRTSSGLPSTSSITRNASATFSSIVLMIFRS